VFPRSFYLASLTFGCLWNSSSRAYATSNKSEKENVIRVYLRGIAGFTDLRTAFARAQNAILLSRDFDLRVERARKNSLFTKLIYQNPVGRPYFSNAKTLFNSKTGMHVRNCKKTQTNKTNKEKNCGAEFFQLGNFHFC